MIIFVTFLAHSGDCIILCDIATDRYLLRGVNLIQADILIDEHMLPDDFLELGLELLSLHLFFQAVQFRIVLKEDINALQAWPSACDIDRQILIVAQDEVVRTVVQKHLDRPRIVIVGQPVQGGHTCLVTGQVRVHVRPEQLLYDSVAIFYRVILLPDDVVAAEANGEERREASIVPTVDQHRLILLIAEQSLHLIDDEAADSHVSILCPEV